MTPLYRAKRGTRRVDDVTGEVHEVRADPDARLHVEGGGSRVRGNKFVLVAARNAYDRLLLDVEHDAGRKGDRGEAGAALRCFERLAPQLPGAQGVVYDQAMRGVHIDHVMCELGWLIITGVRAARDRDGALHSRLIESTEAQGSNGESMRLSIYARDGAAGLGELTETGDTVFVPLERMKIERRASAHTYRFYGLYQLPAEYGGVRFASA